MQTAIYVRVSTDEQAQAGFSIRAQTQKLKDYAGIKDWTVHKIYADEGISGKDIKSRPAVMELIEDVKSGLVQNVLVYKIDRLTRSTADLIYLVDLFNNYHCAFNSLMESIDTQTASGRLFLKIIGIFAEFERENIIERTRLGLERKVKEGYTLCTAQASFGYDRTSGETIQRINEPQAQIVREIFELFVCDGASLIEIARRLNMRGVKTKADKTWNGTKVRRVLQNCNYIGKVRHHTADKVRIREWEGLHEPIISQELFDAAALMLASNQKITPKKQPGNDKYFSGFLVCAKCGHRLKTYETHKQTKDAKQKAVGYVCPNHTLKTCQVGSISHKKIEKAFETYLSRFAELECPDDILLEEITQRRKMSKPDIQRYENILRQLEAKRKEVQQLYAVSELAFEEYKKIMKSIDSDRQLLTAELERERAQKEETVVDNSHIILSLKENWCLLSNAQRRSFLRLFVERIEVCCEKTEGGYFNKIESIRVQWREDI